MLGLNFNLEDTSVLRFFYDIKDSVIFSTIYSKLTSIAKEVFKCINNFYKNISNHVNNKLFKRNIRQVPIPIHLTIKDRNYFSESDVVDDTPPKNENNLQIVFYQSMNSNRAFNIVKVTIPRDISINSNKKFSFLKSMLKTHLAPCQPKNNNLQLVVYQGEKSEVKTTTTPLQPKNNNNLQLVVYQGEKSDVKTPTTPLQPKNNNNLQLVVYQGEKAEVKTPLTKQKLFRTQTSSSKNVLRPITNILMNKIFKTNLPQVNEKKLHATIYQDQFPLKGKENNNSPIVVKTNSENKISEDDEMIIEDKQGIKVGIVRNHQLISGVKINYDRSIKEEGKFKSGNLEKGTRTVYEEYIEDGRFKKGKLVEGTLTYFDGLVEDGTFNENGLLSGEWCERNDHEKIERGVFKKGDLIEGTITCKKSMAILRGSFDPENGELILGTVQYPNGLFLIIADKEVIRREIH